MAVKVIKHNEIMSKHENEERWAENVLVNESHRAVWIVAPEGTPPDPHIHPDFNEFWIALDGSTRWQIGQYEPLETEWGDVVMAPAGFSHDIRPMRGKINLRIGISHPDSNHDIKGIVPCRFIPIEQDYTSNNLVHSKLSEIIKHNGDNKNWKVNVISDERSKVYTTQQIANFNQKIDIKSNEESHWIFIIEGHLEIKCDSQEFNLQRGDIISLDKISSYELINNSNEKLIFTTILIDSGD